VIHTENEVITPNESGLSAPERWSDLSGEDYTKLNSLVDNQLSMTGQGCLRTMVDLATGKVARLHREVEQIHQLAKLPLKVEDTKQAIGASMLIAMGSRSSQEVDDKLLQAKMKALGEEGKTRDSNVDERVEKILRFGELVAKKAYVKRQEVMR
jgi:hypothetical protein